MSKRANRGFTLVEVLIVVVVMAVLAAAIVPQFTSATDDAKINTAKFNLQSLRSMSQLYRSQHNGTAPSTLDKLTQSTDISGATGTGANYPYGPYLQKLPMNTKNNLNSVGTATTNPPTTADGSTGWLYHAASGNVWLNDAALYTE
jgi:general secretion pathway protein G